MNIRKLQNEIFTVYTNGAQASLFNNWELDGSPADGRVTPAAPFFHSYHDYEATLPLLTIINNNQIVVIQDISSLQGQHFLIQELKNLGAKQISNSSTSHIFGALQNNKNYDYNSDLAENDEAIALALLENDTPQDYEQVIQQISSDEDLARRLAEEERINPSLS